MTLQSARDALIQRDKRFPVEQAGGAAAQQRPGDDQGGPYCNLARNLTGWMRQPDYPFKSWLQQRIGMLVDSIPNSHFTATRHDGPA